MQPVSPVAAIEHLCSCVQINNLVVNLTQYNLATGWHSSEIDTRKRSTRAATLGEPRRFVTRHLFEAISDWYGLDGC
jgi:hypothetical protein